MFTITKIAPNNFSHFDGFKEMNFSNWEINFNNTTNTIILQLRNGAPFPKKEVLASEVIIKDGIDGTPETFSTTEQIRTRLLALNYNPLVVSGGGGGAVDSVNGQTGVVVLDAEDVGAIPLSGTTVGNPITGDLEINSKEGEEKALILSKEGTVGITENPKFSFGRIVNGGINEPKLRILFIDDEAYTSEITCFEVEPSGTAASVRSVIGSHYEGFLEGEEKPLFRIASFLKDGIKSTRMEFGSGGNNETDIFLERWASWAFALVMGGSPKVIFYPDSILRQPGVVDAFQQTPIGQVVATPNPDVKKLFYREGKGLVELGGDGIEKPLVNNNSGNFIPLSGTTAGNPITGKLQTDSVTALSSTQSDMYIGIANNSDLEDTSTHAQIQFSSSEHSKTTSLTNTSPTGINTTLSIQSSDSVEGFESIIKVFSNDPLFRGLSGNQDFTPNITDLDYTQKKYVDTKAPLNPRVQSVTSSATVTPTSTNDIVTITAQAVALTLANPTGTFAEGQALMIRIKDNGTARAITFGSNYRAIGVTLPTTTIANKILYLGIIYDSIDAKWNILGINLQA